MERAWVPHCLIPLLGIMSLIRNNILEEVEG